METITLILLIIVILFFIFLIIKSFLKGGYKDKFCVLCASVLVTWLVLLISNLFNNKIIIGILMGTSITGVFYFLESHIEEKLKIYRLPFFVTMIAIVYFLISKLIIETIYLLIILWLVFIFMYLFQNNQTLRGISKKIIECCKKW